MAKAVSADGGSAGAGAPQAVDQRASKNDLAEHPDPVVAFLKRTRGRLKRYPKLDV
ncbi:hypothetical protein [Salinarimonas ramus]|uniref:Uncharacterized protein n=1 Tax=Salinarimonas ramus TaxID=690164 RepID=A0A917QIG5_9HYPH|nr:hypothetical protein [Salinarimonas ramus]GGK50481.1 hypothetical protein GCM10011322_41930 [Salinarimonas ramus]